MAARNRYASKFFEIEHGFEEYLLEIAQLQLKNNKRIKKERAKVFGLHFRGDVMRLAYFVTVWVMAKIYFGVFIILKIADEAKNSLKMRPPINFEKASNCLQSSQL